MDRPTRTESGPRWGIALAESAYAFLLFAMPAEFRRRYAHDARQVFVDLCTDAFDSAGYAGVFTVFRRTLFGTLRGALAERWGNARRAGRRTTPLRPYNRQRDTMHIRQDLLYALRSYRKRPAFTLAVLLTLTLGIGATTTIFSVVDGVLLRTLPYPDANRLVYFDEGSHTGPDYVDWRQRLTAFDEIAAVWPTMQNLTNEGDPQQVTVARATSNLFPMLGTRARLGRLLSQGDETSGAAPVAVLSHSFWLNRWGGDSTVLGRTLRLDGDLYEIVGVSEDDPPAPSRVVRRVPDVWIPLDLNREDLQRRTRYVLGVLGHLSAGASLAQASEQIDAWEIWASETYPENYVSPSGETRDIPLVTLHEATVGQARATLSLLFVAVGLMLLIACVNVANLFLAAGSARVRELAVRAALGASRTRLLVQSLTECAAMSVTGGLLGIGLSLFAVRAVTALAPAQIPRLAGVAIDYRVMIFTLLVSLTTGILFGVAPALYATRVDLLEAMKDVDRASAPARGRVHLKSGLIVTELAMAIMLLAGAGLMFNSFIRLNRVDPGFVSRNLITTSLQLGPSYDEPPGRRLEFARELLAGVSAIPGVEVASVGVTAPFAMGGRCCYMSRARFRTGSAVDSMRVVIHPIGPRYLETLGARLIQGRELTWNEPIEGESVVLISRRMAERFFAQDEALGKLITVGRSESPFRVVGVFEEVMYWSLARDEDVDLYVPYDAYAEDMPLFSVLARTGVDPTAIVEPLRQAVWSIDPELPVANISTMDVRVRETITDTRFLSVLLIVFSLIATVLAATGVYGTMLYVVLQRRHEFGVRIALGASTGQLLRPVMKHGILLTVLGLALGSAAALAVSRVLSSMLFGVTPTDAPTFIGVSLLLGLVAVTATYFPARRATKVDPIGSLRRH